MLAGLILISLALPLQAQSRTDDGPFYHPLDQTSPTGMAGYWASAIGVAKPGAFQPVRVELPSSGDVTFYSGRPEGPVALESPAQVHLAVGHTYRLRITNMPEHPGIELYPTVEVIDRLHPPAGSADRFPVPVQFTADEIQLVLNGRFVTKVVFLENSLSAPARELPRPLLVETISANRNVLAEADRQGRPLAIIRMGGRVPSGNGHQRAFYGTGAPLLVPRLSRSRDKVRPASAASEPSAKIRPTTFTPAERRLPLRNIARHFPNPEAFSNVASTSAQDFPDEYLYDGGDRGDAVHHNEFGRLGLDTEDTVGEFVDDKGRRRVVPSNRVAVYAPRFAAVRTVSAINADVAVEKVAGAMKSTYGAGLGNRVAPNHQTQNDKLNGIRVRSRASGLDVETTPSSIAQQTAYAGHAKLLNVFEEMAFFQTGALISGEKARIKYGREAAQIWTRRQFPVISAKFDGTHLVEARFKPQEFIGLEDKNVTKGRLRIVKLADKQLAEPGDVITFTIRYDNLGDRALREIQIVDNLTPRLEYITDSATSDREGELDIEANEAGSLILHFHVIGELPGHQGGVVTFKVKVR